MTKAETVDVVLLLLTLCAVLSLSVVKSVAMTWVALEWLALICLLSFVSPKISLVTSFLNSTVTGILWPESRHWLWVLAITLNLIAIAETFPFVFG
ncbi:hypothetical protein MO867_10905 [Microbulbifer sp. OS29]|uniref:Uncharacterized protein n=1 Tax=Microbulbifer okhotskensis TaxID=2926617 RepID=A0A9X2EM88_9GAMM|nr:hypothetical protein [Microbulbifer okhotskensis]MCO1334849.1 hypothetical protein [Microbulbifer okhotskensis]